jgi:hypothetical protein
MSENPSMAPPDTSQVSPVDFVKAAEQQGFRVMLGKSPGQRSPDSLAIIKRVYALGGKPQTDAIDAGFHLLAMVPRTGYMEAIPWKMSEPVAAGAAPFETAHLLVTMGVTHVDLDYLAQLQEPAEAAAGRLSEREALDHDFNVKVESEIDTDPQIQALNRELANTETLAVALKTQIKTHRDRLRAARQDRRRDYHYVVSEREL